MAKFIPTVGDIRGKIGAFVWSSNKFGTYIRSLGQMQTGGTQWQVIRRGYVQSAMNSWASLTEAQRTQWSAWASTNPTITKNLSAAQLYVKLNVWRLAEVLSILTTPPAVHSGQELTALSYGNVAADWNPASLKVTFAPGPVPVGHYFVVYATAPTTRKIDSAHWRNLVRKVQSFPAAQASPADITTAYVARFGTPVVGQYIGIWVRLYHHIDAVLGALSYFSEGINATDSGADFTMRPVMATP